MARFDKVGKAILLLREKQNKSQKELAAEAGITGAMLSNYETGVKKPSLDSMGKILDALGLYLGKLDDALDVVNDRELRSRAEEPPRAAPWTPDGVDLPRFLGADRDLPPELQLGFAEMVHGFQRVARHVYETVVSGRRDR
jgi:transcriptional regulator with XRE-family HTH domain